MKTSEREKRDLARTRRRILDAAAAAFAGRGLAGARMDAIARRARVSKAMIYYTFGNKDDLHLAVLESLFEEKTRNLDAGISAAPSREDFLAMLEVYYEAFLDRRAYALIMINDLVTGGEALRRLRKKRPDLFAVFDGVSGRLRESADQGKVRDLDPDKTIMTLIFFLASLVCVMPHMDLVRARGSEAHQNLSDPEQWKSFLAELLARIF